MMFNVFYLLQGVPHTGVDLPLGQLPPTLTFRSAHLLQELEMNVKFTAAAANATDPTRLEQRRMQGFPAY